MPFPTIPFVGTAFNWITKGVGQWFKHKKYKGLDGYYLVCSQQANPFRNSPDHVPNFLKITTSLVSAGDLDIVSKDFDRHYKHKWKTWKATITMKGNAGSGQYHYTEGAEIGNHQIQLKDDDTIVVRITDLGKANLSKRTDNEPAVQVWKKVQPNDPLISTFENLLKLP